MSARTSALERAPSAELAQATLDALRAGAPFPEAGVVLLLRLVEQELGSFSSTLLVGRIDRADAVLEHTHDFFLARRGALVDYLLTSTTDGESAARGMRRVIVNWLIDQARRTAIGSLEHRLHQLLSAEHDRFERVPARTPGAGRWRLAGTDVPAWGGDHGVLDAAARTSRATAVRWSSEDRRPPVARRHELIAMLEAVLEAAQGSVSAAVLARTVAHRLPAAMDPVPVSLDAAADRGSLQVQTPAAEDIVSLLIDVREQQAAATEILAQLTSEERFVLAHAEDNAAVMARGGVGRSAAALRTKRAREVVRELAGAHENPRAVVAALIDLLRVPTSRFNGESPVAEAHRP